MAKRSKIVGVALAGVAIATAGFGVGDSPRDAIERANELFRTAQFKPASEAYDAITEPVDPALVADLLHNRAAAAFKLGDYAKARDLWVRCATTKDAPFEAAARYNLGNCAYREALDKLAPPGGATGEATQPPIDEVKALIEHAIEQYRDGLRLDSSLLDARANLELAAQLLEKLNEKTDSQPQSQDSQPQSKPQSQPSSQSQPQDGQGGEGGESNQDSQSQPSSRPEDEKSEGKDDEQKSKDEPESQPAGDEEPRPDTQPVTQPASRPAAASQPAGEPEEKEAGEPTTAPTRLSPADAERLLQRVRDAEKARRETLRARERGRQKPVDRDW